jgi:hypothetical protein
LKTHAPPIAERTPHPAQRAGASRNSRLCGQVSQLRAMIERSPAMLAQRRACAAIQREQSEAKPRPDTLKLLRTERLLAILQEKHSNGLLDKFAAGTVPDALSSAGSFGAAWESYTDILAGAVQAPAAALMQALNAAGARGQGDAASDALAALASRIQGLSGLDSAAEIAAAALDIRKEIARLCQLVCTLLARLQRQASGDEPWQRAKKPAGAMPPAPEIDTTSPPAKETVPGEQQNG